MKKISQSLLKLVLLLNDGAIHDGDALGVSLGVSRAAVWKMIKKLREYGVVIHSTKAKGYQLAEPLSLLQEDKIVQELYHQPVRVVCFENVTSTNDYLKVHPAYDKRLFDVCLAEMQTAGRGRLGRHWVSPFGQNIYLSCRYYVEKDISELGGLSLVAGLSVVAALTTLGIRDVRVKWPNDVFYQGQKLAGILVEVRAETHMLSEVIIGIGMNVNMEVNAASQFTEIAQYVTSLAEMQGHYCDRNEIAVVLIKQLLSDVQLFTAEGWAAFTTRWDNVDYLNGKSISLLQGEKRLSGVARGVNENGYLLFQDQEGVSRLFSSGEVSIAKDG